MLVAFWGAVDITPMAGIKRTGEQNMLNQVVCVVDLTYPRRGRDIDCRETLSPLSSINNCLKLSFK
jgi:hypothetical protein